MNVSSMIRGQSLPKPAVCDCGHAPTPTDLSTGYARTADGKTLCYECAADVDREKARTMQRGDSPLVAYVRDWPTGGGVHRVDIVTWPGVKLGWGFVGRNVSRYATRHHVTATIEGRKFWGWTPAHSGNYVTLRPYAKEVTANV